jgi:hypothetical protein
MMQKPSHILPWIKLLKKHFQQHALIQIHDQWMTSDTLAEYICLRVNLLEYNSSTGIQLDKNFQSRANAYTSTAMDVDWQNVPLDQFGIFRDQCYLPKRTTCYDVCEIGQAPKKLQR